MATPIPTPEQLQRLLQADVIWLATVRPNSTPHLSPIWFVWNENKAYVCTPRSAVKTRNIAANPSVTFSLEDGNHPLVLEGSARLLTEIPSAVAELFVTKYEWDVRNNETYNALIEITPTRIR